MARHEPVKGVARRGGRRQRPADPHVAQRQRAHRRRATSTRSYLIEIAERCLSAVPAIVPGDLSGTLHWAWATRYNTTLLDMALGDAYSFIAERPALWELLCKVRGAANRSIADAEALAGIVHLGMDNRETHAPVAATPVTTDSAPRVPRLTAGTSA